MLSATRPSFTALLGTAVAALTVAAVAGPAPLAPYPDSAGPIVVVEGDAGRVRIVSPDGTSDVLLDGLVDPRGVALSPDGLLLVVAVAGAAPGQGILVGITSDGGTDVLLSELDFPDGVAFVDAGTLVFTTAGPSPINVFSGGQHRSLSDGFTGEPTGVAGVTWGAEPGAAIVTSEAAAFHFDPGTDEMFEITPPLSGGGHPAFSTALGLCVPESVENRVRCFPVDGGNPRVFIGLVQPAGVTIADDGGILVVSGPTGLTFVDTGNGAVVGTGGPLGGTGGVVALGDHAAQWLTATPTTTTEPEETTTTTEGEDTTTTTEVEETTTTTEAVEPEEDDEDEDAGILWWIVILLVLALAGVAAYLAARRRTPPPGSVGAAFEPADEPPPPDPGSPLPAPPRPPDDMPPA
jgi:hypothetical protein